MTDRLISIDLSRPTIPVRYLLDVFERARPPKATIERALQAASLRKSALDSPRMRVSIAQYERVHAVLIRETNDELYGFFAAPVPAGAYATLLRLLTGSIDLASALDSAERFYRLFDRHRYWRWTTSAGRDERPGSSPFRPAAVRGALKAPARLELHPRDTGQARSIFFVHSMLLAPWRTVCWLGARTLPLDAVQLPLAFRRFRAETEYLFGCRPDFARGVASIELKASHLELPVARTALDAEKFVQTSLRELLLAPEDTTLAGELRALLASAKPIAAISIDEAAKKLGVSRATLARRLKERRVSFQAVKDEVRRDQAITLLTATSLPIADIAERLGYSAQSAFQRAFREWTGVAPGSVRRGRGADQLRQR